MPHDRMPHDRMPHDLMPHDLMPYNALCARFRMKDKRRLCWIEFNVREVTVHKTWIKKIGAMNKCRIKIESSHLYHHHLIMAGVRNWWGGGGRCFSNLYLKHLRLLHRIQRHRLFSVHDLWWLLAPISYVFSCTSGPITMGEVKPGITLILSLKLAYSRTVG